MAIVKARKEDLSQCVDILFSSSLGQMYYPIRELLEEEVERGVLKDDLYVENGGGYDSLISGVIWYQREGMFHSFPYLHMIAVKDEFKRQGIGTRLMDYFEKDVLVNGRNHLRTKAFLTVGEFNPGAEMFYLDRGYVELGQIKALFRRGITEKLMMKKITATK